MITINQSKVLDYINANSSLKDFFTYYLNNCITLTNPYHNINHTMSMMFHIINIYELSQQNKYDFNLSDNDLYILLLSALFHDYNHSGGLYEDSVNVNIAIDNVTNVINKYFENNEDKQNLINTVIDIIKATEYPYTIESSELNLYQKIIRECDILVFFSTDFFTQTLIGLKTELRIKDWNTFFKKETEFLLYAFKQLSLKYSKNIVNEHYESLLDIIDKLIKILNF